MNLTKAGSKNCPTYYIQKSIRIGKKTSTKTVERLEYEKNFESDQKEVKITTYFSIKKTSQTAYLRWLRGFYLSLTVKNGIID